MIAGTNLIQSSFVYGIRNYLQVYHSLHNTSNADILTLCMERVVAEGMRLSLTLHCRSMTHYFHPDWKPSLLSFALILLYHGFPDLH